MMSEGKGIDSKAIDAMSSVIRQYEKSGEIYINDFYFGSLGSPSNGTPLLQIEPTGDRTLRLNVNTDIFSGRSLSEINDIILNSSLTLAKNLDEAIIHEYGNVKTVQGKTIAEIRELYNELSQIHYTGISDIAESDGAECLAEIEILISRGENISEDIMEFYNKYIKGEK